MSQFSFEKKESGSDLELHLKGGIDEDSSFQGIELTNYKNIVIDLDGVTAINSCGIREWVKWIRSTPPEGKVIIRNCPKVIVDQINMVAGFLPPNGTVESFYVPYFSEASGSEKMILFRKGSEFQSGEVTPPVGVKDESGEEMEMDVIEAKYFKFLKSA